MYVILDIDIERWEVLKKEGVDIEGSEVEKVFIEDKVKPFIEDKISIGSYNGGFSLEYNKEHFKGFYDIRENINLLRLVLINTDVDFEDMETEYEDKLTGLGGRKKFIKDIRNKLDNEVEFQVLIFDIDNFRNINDVYGYEQSNSLMKELIDRILMGLFSNYDLYRIEGDTFSFIREGRNVELFIEDLFKLMDDPFYIDNKKVYITISLGYVNVYDVFLNEYDRLIDDAFTALNNAKSMGKNTWVEYEDKLRENSLREMELESLIRTALRENQFSLNYQPQMRLDNDLKLKGAEALIRWIHPEEGFISPGLFIPVAEKSGLIVQIGEWVVNEVCRQQREWLDEGICVKRVDINIGAHHFRKRSFVNDIKRTLEKYNIDASLIGLEITESSVVQDVDDMIVKLNELKDMGISVSIDDFGTGYSSLSYLTKFPVDTLKIDQAFILNIPSDKDNIVIVKAIISLAKHMNLKVIAEGVETEAARDLLRMLDCTDMQGYFFSKPVSSEEYRLELINQP